jgi:riboflavin transporter
MNKTKKLAIDSLLAAMCAVLGAVAIDLSSIKITLESFPVLLGALLFGPIDGMAIGFVGTLLYQLLRYGVSATTLLWILPYAVSGLLVGAYAKKKGYWLNAGQTLLIVVISEVIVTLLNTGVMYVDAKMYGYWFRGFITAMLIPRALVCVLKSAVFGTILPKIVQVVRRTVPIGKEENI